MISSQQLLQFVQSAIRSVKGRKREQAAFAIAALCFSGGFTLPKIVPDFLVGKWISSLQIALYAIGAIALAYGVVRVWRLVNPLELPPAKDRPSAIKGPMAFTEADGELFRKLGRESELQKLLGLVLDNQVLMIVVRGASGAGKTSLLRAGLKHIVGDDAVFHYWEGVPVESDKGLLRAIQERWPEGAGKPAALPDLVNPSDALGRQSHVIVLDQFEQLRGNRKIFQLLRRIVRESKPPHRITWVIAFRREFSADWLDFISPEQENGVRPPQDVSLRLFTAEQAREVIAQLINESDLRDSIEQSVINNLVEAATVDGEVSPVDIGIGLLVLSELHERQSGQTITIRDYQFAGGAEGLLTQYISRCLEPFPKESQEAILKAMLALRDPEENLERLATGLSIDELAAEVATDLRVLKLQLNRLADRDIRLLEADMPTDGSAVRYRLPHERLIPALYRLTGKLLAEVGQAKLKFQNAFQAWQTNDKRSRYLLKGKELRLVLRYETQIPWGQDEQEKKSFLFRSKRRWKFVSAAMVAAVLALIGAGWVTRFQIQQIQLRNQQLRHKEFLRGESGYPTELYDFQHQLKKLEMTGPLNLERFTWLSSDSIEELSVNAASTSNSIAGLTSLSRCRSLKKLTLNLSNSQVSDLQPLAQLQGLTQLTLRLSHSQESDLKPLAQLQGLTQLTLDLRGTRVSDLQPFEQLKGLMQLTQLTLNLTGTQVSDLKPLQQLTGLTQLTLFLSISKVSDLKPLEQLTGLTQLTLDLSFSKVSDLKPLQQLTGLTQLTLDLGGAEVSNLKPLQQLKRLTQLTLRGAKLSDLKPFEQFTELTTLTLDISNFVFRDLKYFEQLRRLTQLTQLTLDLRYTQVSELKPLEQLTGLTQLTLFLSRTQVSEMQLLEQLKRLETKLSLRVMQVSTLASPEQLNLQSLEQLKGLRKLTLDLSRTQVSDLQPLEQLTGLTQLTLELDDSQVRNLQPLEQLTGLTQLTLDLGDSQVRNLQPLKQLMGLTQLTLLLSDSQVSNLESVLELTGLQTLSIYGATRAQRMSLRSIPANLVELKF